MELKRYLENSSWLNELNSEFDKAYFKQLESLIERDLEQGKTIYPPQDKVFKALNATPLNEVKVIILGQDPYHRPGQAQGLSFSVPEDIKTPPSLKNIFKELKTDIGKVRNSSNLEDWAKQGVLLLNTSLTVSEGLAGSHSNYGWNCFTDAILKAVNNTNENCVFILWGSFAHKKRNLINEEKHLVISSVHPSPLSAYRGFFGSEPFSKTNHYLVKRNQNPIIWV